MKEKPPFVPTRTCPHRWCRMLHLTPVPFMLAVLAFDLWHNWVYLLVLSVFMYMGWWVQKAVHMRPRPRNGPVTVRNVVQDIREAPSPIDLEMEDAKYAGTGWRMLEVRKGWARVAVGMDILLVVITGTAITAIFASPEATAAGAEHSTADPSTYVGMATGLVLFGFSMYAHKKATQPRKPKRARVPASMRTNT